MKNSHEIGFLFDLDGVLIDSESEYTGIWTEINDCFPTGINNFALAIKGQTLPEILGKYFSPEIHDEVVTMLYEKEQKMRYEYLPGARELLEEIKNEGYGCILVTSSNEMKMKHLREERPELPSYFKDMVTADKVNHSKPDPEGYILGAKMLNLTSADCVVFEDSLQGVMAGKRSGAFVIGLSTTLDAETLRPHCDMIIKDLSETNLKMIINTLKDE